MKALASSGSDTLDRRNSPGGRVESECLEILGILGEFLNIATYCAAFRVDSAEDLICNPAPKTEEKS